MVTRQQNTQKRLQSYLELRSLYVNNKYIMKHIYCTLLKLFALEVDTLSHLLTVLKAACIKI